MKYNQDYPDSIKGLRTRKGPLVFSLGPAANNMNISCEMWDYVHNG